MIGGSHSFVVYFDGSNQMDPDAQRAAMPFY